MNIIRFSYDHVKAAAEIEKLCFSEPWSENGLRLLCGEPYGAGHGVGFAAVENGKLMAYAGMVVILDEGELVTVATHPDARRRGLARQVLSALFAYAEENGITNISLEVRQSNTAARRLYESEGFAKVGKRAGFYSNPREDAIIMIRNS